MGIARWRRWIRFHLVTAVGLAAAFTLFVVALSLPGAIEAKNRTLDHRTPSLVRGTPSASEPQPFAAVSYDDVYDDTRVDVVAVSVTHGPVKTPEGPVLTKPGDVVASASLSRLLQTPQRSRLLARIDGQRLSQTLPVADAAVPEELFAYVAVTDAQIKSLCRCKLTDLGLAAFNHRGGRSSSGLDFGFVFLISLAAVLMLAVLYNSATLAAGLLAERERRLIGELSLLGAPRWASSTVLLSGLMIDVALASGTGLLLARPLGTYLSEFPPPDYKLPFRTLGYATLTTATIAVACLALVCVAAVMNAGRGVASDSTIAAVRTAGSDAAGTNRGPIIGAVGVVLLALSGATSRWADSYTVWIVIMLGLGVLATARGIMETPRWIAFIAGRTRGTSNSPTNHLVRSQLNAPGRRFALEGVIAGLIIATGILTAYTAVARGGDAITLGSSYESLKTDTIVVADASQTEADQLSKLTGGLSVELQLVNAQSSRGEPYTVVVGECQRLKAVVSSPDSFVCDQMQPIALDQTLAASATGMRRHPAPPQGATLVGLNEDGTAAGAITVGEYADGAVELPGELWLYGSTALVEPSSLDFRVDPDATRWVYIPGDHFNVEQVRDVLAPSVRSDAQTAGKLARQGNRAQLDFFRSVTVLGGLILALVAGLALGMSSLAEFNRIQRSTTASMLLGSPTRTVATSLGLSSAIRMATIVVASAAAATLAGLAYTRLVRADEYGLAGPLYGFNWWLTAGVGAIAIVAAVIVRHLVVRSAMKSVTTASLR